MTTRTQSRTQSRTRTDTDAGTDGQAQQTPPQPAVWLQVVLPSGASQPVGIALDAPDWERRLDETVTQVKLLVMRDLLTRKPG